MSHLDVFDYHLVFSSIDTLNNLNYVNPHPFSRVSLKFGSCIGGPFERTLCVGNSNNWFLYPWQPERRPTSMNRASKRICDGKNEVRNYVRGCARQCVAVRRAKKCRDSSL